MRVKVTGYVVVENEAEAHELTFADLVDRLTDITIGDEEEEDPDPSGRWAFDD